ncbi:MAG: glycosyltransferase family 2 protein [Gammaproteobacteria bacterium]|jgi:glycosyltransferase involved in cell wall biosynthesis
MKDFTIAIMLPCYNEESAISKVIQDFRRELPQSKIYVYDNNSIDNTRSVALKNGAIVRSAPRKGKGNVVKLMFANIDADIYVLCDGDDTYEAASVNKMIQKLLDEELDMVVGKRVEKNHRDSKTYRKGHRLGNILFSKFVSFFFGKFFTDIFSGYRVFSKRFVKSFPVTASGFDIEADMVIHSLELKLPVAEIDTKYIERPTGSCSKLSTYKDGCKILWRIFLLLKDYKPLLFFSSISLLFVVCGFLFLIPILLTYFSTGLVPRFPTLFVSIGLFVVAFVSFACGLILDNTAKVRHELKYLQYLSLPKLHKDYRKQ